MSWNTQKIESLRKLWDDGVATSQIGQQLGFTKNAVIGKAFRLGLERRQNSRKKVNNNEYSPTIYRETSSINTSSSVSTKSNTLKKREKVQFKKSIIGSSNFQKCQWPIGDPLKEGFHFCSSENIPTKPYCVEHFKSAYNVDDKYLDRLLDFLNYQIKN